MVSCLEWRHKDALDENEDNADAEWGGTIWDRSRLANIRLSSPEVGLLLDAGCGDEQGSDREDWLPLLSMAEGSGAEWVTEEEPGWFWLQIPADAMAWLGSLGLGLGLA